nr:DUF1330 domain-containing protein [Sphingomonas populi]
MTAYILFIRDEPVHDAAEMAEYQRLNRERGSDGFDVKRLAFYGAAEGLEGPTPDGVVVLEFPSVEEAAAGTPVPAIRRRCSTGSRPRSTG